MVLVGYDVVGGRVKFSNGFIGAIYHSKSAPIYIYLASHEPIKAIQTWAARQQLQTVNTD